MPEERSNIKLAAEIAAAFVSNNSVRPADLPTLIGDIHGALLRVSSGAAAVAEPEKLTPAVSIKKSVSDDYIVCLEDGRKFKSLKRHLHNEHNLSPDQYRAKWGLPSDYPMVAPTYAKARSALAFKIGLGSKRRTRK
jgi:predicted transcriptional regulator